MFCAGGLQDDCLQCPCRQNVLRFYAVSPQTGCPTILCSVPACGLHADSAASPQAEGPMILCCVPAARMADDFLQCPRRRKPDKFFQCPCMPNARRFGAESLEADCPTIFKSVPAGKRPDALLQCPCTRNARGFFVTKKLEQIRMILD